MSAKTIKISHEIKVSQNKLQINQLISLIWIVNFKLISQKNFIKAVMCITCNQM